MSARIIDGKRAAAALRARLVGQFRDLKRSHRLDPCLAVVLVGDDPASAIYVAGKNNAARELGFAVRDIRKPANLPEQELLGIVSELNRDSGVHGILVQMPLPDEIRVREVIAAIDPAKDVDGLTPLNLGKLMLGEITRTDGLAACTPSGAVMLLREAAGAELSGKHAVVIGRSNQVGRPMAHLLLQENCTVTIAHSKTEGLPELCRRADIIVAAAGSPELVRGDWIKPGAFVIDVGINRVPGGEGKTRLVGDVAFAEAVERAAAVTPVPGGVGPMTIACLMRNVLMAACRQSGIKVPITT
jgi:methylenetetrahydrofolate dehydrogenase (NADP+)/methenyltetrahydrofolate cyclohydrolase